MQEPRADDAPAADGYAVERQVLYRYPPHEQNYQIVWAIWDRDAKTFLDERFVSREAAERYVARLRTAQGTGGASPPVPISHNGKG